MFQESGFRNRDLQPPLLADVFLVVATIVLVCFSLVMIYSTTGVVSHERIGDSLYYVKRQGIAALVGFLLLYALSFTNIAKLQRFSALFLFLSLGSLLLPLLPGVGDSAGGAQRWIQIASFRFQPVEFAKLFFIIYIAGYFARHESELSSFTAGLLKPGLFIGAMGALLLAQPDFGSASVIAGISLCIALAAGVRFVHLLSAGLAGLAIVVPLILMSPYRLSRVTTFLSPWQDASGKGYQLIQSLIAVGTGQFTGVGLGESQQKLFFLPAAHTDFIFAVIAEELGFLGALVLLAVFLLFAWRGLRIAGRLAEHSFAFLLSIGLTLLIVLPALLNMGVVLGLLPTKGMVLPLVGYGGSSLVASLMAIGLLLAIARSLDDRHAS